MSTFDLIIRNAKELLTLSLSHRDESGLGIIPAGAVGVREGKIAWIGETKDFPTGVSLYPGGKEIDATGKVVMPGLIDAHTHLVFGGSREHEFELRIQGLS